MNSKLFSSIAIAVVALIAAAPLSHAAAVTPTNFKKTLTQKLKNKKGAAVYNTAASYLKSVLGDAKNSKNVVAYMGSIVPFIYNKDLVPVALQGSAANTLTNAMTQGYFSKVPFKFNDGKWNQALGKLYAKLPTSQKIEKVSQACYNSIKITATKKGQTKLATFNYFVNTIAPKNNFPPPNVS